MKQEKANEEENKQKIEELSKKIPLKKDKIDDATSKGVSQQILKKIFINILQAAGIIIYFAILNVIYTKIEQERILNIVEICSGILLLTALILLEVSYKKDNESITISGIEYLVLAFHSLSIKYVITRYNYQFQIYLLTSSYVFSIYYILKAIILYTKGRREYLSTLSDISEIVKKDEPIVKEAKKRNEEVDIKKASNEQKPKTIKKRGTRKKKDTEELNHKSKEKKKNTSKKDETEKNVDNKKKQIRKRTTKKVKQDEKQQQEEKNVKNKKTDSNKTTTKNNKKEE